MGMNVDCLLWEALNQHLKRALAVKSFTDVDLTENKLNEAAAKIMADPRRATAVQQDCPQDYADIQARGAQTGMAGTVADPAHSAAHMDNWLSGLTDDQLAELEKAVRAKIATRKKPKSKPAPKGMK